MAAIFVPPYGAESQMTLAKEMPTAQTTEIELDSNDQENASAEEGDGNYSITAARHRPRHPLKGGNGKPIVIKPYPMPIVEPGKPHPIFSEGTTLENVETHMLCNDWFLKNVRNLVAEYKALRDENMRQTRQIVGLERDVAELKISVQNITEERDEYKADYDSEVLEHQKTQDILRAVGLELADLKNRYNLNLAELKRQRALLAEAVRENNRLKVDLADRAARIRDLEEKLRISNASEDAANERVTELQRVIYELERTKTRLEKLKDKAEQECRAAIDSVRYLEEKVVVLNREIRRLSRGREVGIYAQETQVMSIAQDETEPTSYEGADEAPAPPADYDSAAQAYEASTTEAAETSSPANEE